MTQLTIQDLADYAGGDTAGTTTLLARLPGTVQPQTGDSFARIGAAGVSLSAIPDLAGVTTLLSRLSAARAGYLDHVNNSTLAAAVFPTDPADASLVLAATDALAAAIAALNTLSPAQVRTAVGLASAKSPSVIWRGAPPSTSTTNTCGRRS